MVSPAGNTSGTEATNSSKPLPPHPTATTTTIAATTIPDDNTTLTSAPQINTKSGASIYSKPLMLTAYDKYVLGFSMTHLWRCPSKTILIPLFRQNFRAEKHLDIGVGTGFFIGDALAERLAKDEHLMPLERDQDSKLVQLKIEITLMDLNAVALEKAKGRIMGVVNKARAAGGHGNGGSGKQSEHGTNVASQTVNVTTIQADVLDESLVFPHGKLSEISKQFKSVSMFNLLHCLPAAPEAQGGQEIKNRAFKLAAACLADDGVLVGCTILGRKYIANPSRPSHGSSGGTGSGSGVPVRKGGSVGRTTSSKKPFILKRSMTWTVMKWYNATGVFGNWADEREGFEKGLRENFEVVETHVEGCMLLFNAARPKRSEL
ncbi:uncharacterized protein NCU05822 [Neurospora crassa OR74A]|uniref:Methyltransferase n=1 Tax=Neurospora crassa (strain ATCC 24698 / 74-OR23-1A / CBS 708.71 / DSM 1257 / FGSC 987) TaxID=367110 RepID=V5IKJ4_NEUCR|nr:hypothetical protein NCU05822 [Neurospora crassa OR74A]XP_011395208.1 uncharacterized protein NCU05822 [Neurospora crassa OR74A]ESA42068.1 hypothetical protein NCU05822 [Neurospora crassa OR74A]ESA42069.1 hypothetical protein, variant [Neurospora crassa OR74A]|eukprot:XP_011395207.1 hypothetical protein NCU05822 [Neurospora crassa OR74A]